MPHCCLVSRWPLVFRWCLACLVLHWCLARRGFLGCLRLEAANNAQLIQSRLGTLTARLTGEAAPGNAI